jgi:hypothetical protein
MDMGLTEADLANAVQHPDLMQELRAIVLKASERKNAESKTAIVVHHRRQAFRNVAERICTDLASKGYTVSIHPPTPPNDKGPMLDGSAASQIAILPRAGLQEDLGKYDPKQLLALLDTEEAEAFSEGMEERYMFFMHRLLNDVREYIQKTTNAP